jgi:hypothetical protein
MIGSMSLHRFALIASLSFFLTGCLNSSTLLRVKPDGSGTIEHTMLVNLQAFKGLMAGMGGGGQMKESGGVMNEAEFKRTAERMGVKPVSLTPLKEGDFEGAKAVFAFDDITKIRVDQDPMGSGAKAATSGSNSPIRFGLTRSGGTSQLTITFDEKQASAAAGKVNVNPTPSTESIDPAMMQMVKTMFQGFKVGIDLEVDGKIVKTNADYVNGSRITLLEIEMAGLFEDEAKLKALQSKIGPGATISEIKPYLKDVKGVKINHPVITIDYR